MPAVARPLLISIPVISWAESILLLRRVIRITSMLRASLLFPIAAAAITLAARLVPGRLLMAARAGLSWRVLRAARSETAGAVEATITRTGTIRESWWIQIIPTACSSTLLTFGSQ